MARCTCHWRRVLICVCTPCISMVLLFIYISVMLVMDFHTTSVPGKIYPKDPVLDTPYFVASGIWKNTSFSPLPKTFWELHVDALWNRLQLTIDRHFNPILSPNTTKRGYKNSSFYESLLQQGFSEVINLNSSRRHFEQLPQEIKEFVSHMQRRDYPTLLQPDGVCGAGAKREKEPPLLLLAIKSTEMNFMNRQAIRQTWGQAGWVAGQKSNRTGKHGVYVRRVFLLGNRHMENLGVDVSELLQLESQLYGDILQWDFKDTFFNLTLKDVLFWSWFSSTCGRTRFVLKGDDDVFVNTPKIITYLQDELKKPDAHKTIKDFMIGDVIAAALPSRVNKSKYFIPHGFYKGLYPAYAGGGGVLYSGLLTKRLHQVSQRVNLFPIDDVFVGMCMVRLNAHPVHHPAFLTFGFPNKEEEAPCSYHTVLVVHKRSPEQLTKLWADVKKTRQQCRDVSLRQDKKQELLQVSL